MLKELRSGREQADDSQAKGCSTTRPEAEQLPRQRADYLSERQTCDRMVEAMGRKAKEDSDGRRMSPLRQAGIRQARSSRGADT
eukprot:11281067-Alexandrium_andersonii.AAC.1